jgi:phenylacetate-CoA ligase
MQSGGKYKADDLLTHVYTVPWWYASLDGKYPSASCIIAASRADQLTLPNHLVRR